MNIYHNKDVASAVLAEKGPGITGSNSKAIFL